LREILILLLWRRKYILTSCFLIWRSMKNLIDSFWITDQKILL
jgi:hypothetical protein